MPTHPLLTSEQHGRMIVLMDKREHFSNGRLFAFGGGSTLLATTFGAEVSGWNHWLSLGVGYGAGGVLLVLSSVWISKSYLSRESIQPDLVNVSGQPTGSPLEMRWNGFSSEKELLAAECQAHIAFVGERLEAALSPLQVEAIQLAHDLSVFVNGVEPMPEPDKPHTFDGIIDNALNARWAWICKLQTEYEDKYAPRVLAFTRTLGYAGRHNVRMQHFTEHIIDLDSVNTIRAQLWKEVIYPLDIDFTGE